jgi:hypothetical protein
MGPMHFPSALPFFFFSCTFGPLLLG